MVFDLSYIIEAYYSCRKGKRNCRYALDFEFSFENNLYQIYLQLKTHSYKVGESSCFVISYPTIREIFAASFRDRVVHHLLINHIEEVIDKKFIFDSLACRREKGAIFGIKRLQKFLNQITNNKSNNAYYLKLDIKSFFYSIDKDILFKILTSHINKLNYSSKDKNDLLWLSSKIIFHNPCTNYYMKGTLKLLQPLPKDKSLFTVKEGKGLAIGNLTSQFFANLYLNEVDQYIKRELKVKYYLRYADDMLFLSNSVEELERIEKEVREFLSNHLKLSLKKEKTKYGSVYQGIDFVGYIIKPNYILLRNRTVSNLKKKLYYFNKGYLIDRKLCMEEMIPLNNPIAKEQIDSICTSINSTFGHLKWGNSYSLRQNLYKSHFGMLNKYVEPQGNLDSFRPSVPSF
jgi:hypothetical protein